MHCVLKESHVVTNQVIQQCSEEKKPPDTVYKYSNGNHLHSYLRDL